MDLRNLYQEVIIEHSRQPRHFGHLPHPTHHADGFNPLCGDQIHLELEIQHDVIAQVKFTGKGCAISTASASLMTECLIGKTVEQAEKIFNQFHEALTQDDANLEHLPPKLTVLMGVKTYPARVKCATLAWHALHAALNHEQQPVSTEL